MISNTFMPEIPTQKARPAIKLIRGCFGVIALCLALLAQAQDFETLKREAQQGNADAQYILGMIYAQGRGVAQDYAEAETWWRKAAQQGDGYAKLALEPLKLAQASQDFEAVKRAAEQGNATAQNNLAKMYARGFGVAQDDAEAIKWFRKAARQGMADAQGNLGLMYADGQGVKPSDAEAVKWLRKAATQGDANAQFNLGWMLAHGQGVARNKAEAMKWYRKAAGQGHQLAQNVIDYREAPCGSELGICEIPFSLRVASLAIDKEGWRRIMPNDSPELDCESLPVSRAAVLSYFRRVRRVSSGTNHAQVDQSPCHLDGELRTATGRVARWSIGIGSEGELRWQDGKDEDFTYLYCGRCRPDLLYPDWFRPPLAGGAR